MNILSVVTVFWTLDIGLAAVHLGRINKGDKFASRDSRWENNFINDIHINELPSPNLEKQSRNLNMLAIQDEPVPGVNYFEMEIQVFVDSPLYEDIKSSKVSFLEYIQVFFHTVNHIFNMSHPDDETFPMFKIKVVDIQELSPKDESKIFTKVPGEDYSNIDEVLGNFRKKAKKLKFFNYDHTILLTGRDLYRKEGNTFLPDALGVAYFNGTCTNSLDDKKFQSVSVVEDVGAIFLGVFAAVHEIAHNLGSKHDSKKSEKYKCHANRGYIMSPVTKRTDNMFKFSECSLSSMKEFFHSSECLSNTESKPVFPDEPGKFPGDIYTMEDICEHLAEVYYGNEIVVTEVDKRKGSDYLCKQILCKVEILNTGQILTLDPPFAPGENMLCDGGKCMSGECK